MAFEIVDFISNNLLLALWAGSVFVILGFIAAFILRHGAATHPISRCIFSAAATQHIVLRQYVQGVMNYQYCALALVLAVVVHLNIEAQTGKAYLASQALGVVSAICALSGLFLLHLITHTLSLVICSECETTTFFENVRRATCNAYMSITRILDAPKRLLMLSTVVFVAYRAAYFLCDWLDLPVSRKEYEHLRTLIVSAVAFSTVLIITYAALVAKAFARLGRPTVASDRLRAQGAEAGPDVW